MKLSDLLESFSIEVLRDGSFSDLGFDNGIGADLLMPLFDARFKDNLLNCGRLACLLTRADIAPSIPEDVPVAICDNPLETFLDIHIGLVDKNFYRQDHESVIDPSATIHPTAYIEEWGVQIGPRVYVGPRAVVLAGTTIGAGCKIGPNVTIGYEGFEIRELHERQICIPHGGGVVLEENVDVQGNAAVAKSLFASPTRIGADSKIAHMAFVSHGVVLGKRCKLAANATISGSCRIGDDVWIGPGAQLSNRLEIGSGSFISIGSVVINSLPEKSRVSGNFATDHNVALMNSGLRESLSRR